MSWKKVDRCLLMPPKYRQVDNYVFLSEAGVGWHALRGCVYCMQQQISTQMVISHLRAELAPIHNGLLDKEWQPLVAIGHVSRDDFTMLWGTQGM